MSLSEKDVSLWLHNKLGSVDDLWGCQQIYNQFNSTNLTSILECFSDLQPIVKLKLLLSFLSTPLQIFEALEDEIKRIINLACEDEDQWVQSIAIIVQTYPEKFSLNTDLDEDFLNLNEIKNSMAVIDPFKLLPLDSHYLNKAALQHAAGPQMPLAKHFALKRKPKSATLRADLLQKASEVHKNRSKGTTPVVPVRSRTQPSRMISAPVKPKANSQINPSRSNVGGVSKTLRKDQRGTKLIDIGDQPRGAGGKPKRPRIGLPNKDDKSMAGVDEDMPEYAAGLNGMQPPPTPSYVPATPAPNSGYAYQPPQSPLRADQFQPMVFKNNPNYMYKVSNQYQQNPTSSADGQHISSNSENESAPQATLFRKITQPTSQGSFQNQVKLDNFAAPGMSQVFRAREPAPQQQQQQQQQQPQQFNYLPRQPQMFRPLEPSGFAESSKSLGNESHQNTPNQSQQQQLTPEQIAIAKAGEVFRGSNKLTKAEKSLIYSFMAGRLDTNPTENDVVTLMLNENHEKRVLANGEQVELSVATLFEMNYANGQWRILKQTNHV